MLPLSGAVDVAADDAGCELDGRSIGVRRADRRRLPRRRSVGDAAIRATAGGSRCAARVADRRCRCATCAASQVPVELRGAGQSSRQVRNFGTPDSLAGQPRSSPAR